MKKRTRELLLSISKKELIKVEGDLEFKILIGHSNIKISCNKKLNYNKNMVGTEIKKNCGS
jgi:hypothetical protein